MMKGRVRYDYKDHTPLEGEDTMHLPYTKGRDMNQEKFIIIFKGVQHYWQNVEMENKDSIFYKDKFIEKEFKNLCRHSGGTTLKIIKAIKFSILKKGKCYYSQRELAKHFKVSVSTVNQSMQLIEKVLNTKFIPIPKSVINNSLSKHCSYRQILIPPSLHKNLFVVEDNLFVVEDNLFVVTKELECSSFSIPNNFKYLQPYLYTYIINLYNTLIYYTSLLRKEDIKNNSITTRSEALVFSDKNFSFSLTNNDGEIMKHKLNIDNKKVINGKSKRKIDFKDYGLNPKQFISNVEIHRDLEKWLNICVDIDLPPKIENTKMFLNTWNNIGNPRFTKHKLNPKSKTFKLICLALTYRMYSENITFEKVESALNKFINLTERQGVLKYIKKYNCLTTFLWNSQTYIKRDNFQLCLKNEGEILQEYYKCGTKYQKSLEGIRKLFGQVFYFDKPEINKKEFTANYKKFVEFTEEMVTNHTTKEMIGFYPRKYDNGEIESNIDAFYRYIQAYFEYVYNKIKDLNYPNIWSVNYILGEKMKSEFVLWASNNDPQWKDFMKNLEIEKKPKKFKLKIKKNA